MAKDQEPKEAAAESPVAPQEQPTPAAKKDPTGLTYRGDDSRFIEGQPQRDLTVAELLAREPALVRHMTAGATPVYVFTKAGTDAWEAARHD